ncbi:hypothetical protein AE81_02261 [Klebsiella pneumoniae CHS 25]|nr:hypothetical protein AE81_02261 [Klebsiella pneumoniae CHS 25]
MTQILGTGEGKTSSAAKEPVVERKPAQVFFESMALAASMSGYYAGPTATTLGNSWIGSGCGLQNSWIKRHGALKILQLKEHLSGPGLPGRENLSGEPARRLSMTGALAALPHRLHPFRNRGASGDCLTRPRNRYRPYRERRSRRNRDQILKHCPSKTGISMTLLLLTRWGLSRQSMFIFRKLQLEI